MEDAMGEMKVKIAVIMTAVIGVVLVTGLSTADATRTVKLASHITIKGKSLTFSGKVTSSNSACVRGRKVTLYRTKSLKLGTATTSHSGAWKITASGFAGISLGHFFAKVAQRREGTAGTSYVCKAATSRTIPFHQ
jgi:hypothetical protein